ncbi:MAG: diaminopimelate decarboxylase [Verrucomicrobiia bacterium]
MHSFYYTKGKLHCEKVSVEALAEKHGTPLYVYSRNTLTDHYRRLDMALEGLDRLICYAVKANSNLAILRTLAKLGSGFDIVSRGELERVVAAGGDPGKCVFAGVGKTEEEIVYALRQGIYCFNVESEPELERVNRIAGRLGRKAPVAVRLNPNVDAHTHAKVTTGTYENKFGIAFEEVEAVYARASKLKHVELRGLQMHIGSQLTEVKPFRLAVEKAAPLADELARRHGIRFLSIGGGLGIVYRPALASGSPDWWNAPEAQEILTPAKYAAALVPLLKPLDLRILIEPGRFIVGNAGILVTRVEYVKRTGRKNFVIVDAAMNDLIRPAFYDSYHEIVPVRRRTGGQIPSDVVGPICESGDTFCKDRALPKLREGDLIALLSAGAYGSVMSSNYNTRTLVPEVLVDRTRAALVRERQPIASIWDLERIPKWL